jgi:hypothetical protein
MIGYRQIEWIGAKSIFADPVFMFRKAQGSISDEEMQILRNTASKQIYRVEGKTSRVLGEFNPKLGVRDPDLSKVYKWGPHIGDYVQRVSADDWEIIRTCRSWREFRDVTDGIPEDPPLLIPGELVTVKEEDFHSTHDYLAAYRKSVK